MGHKIAESLPPRSSLTTNSVPGDRSDTSQELQDHPGQRAAARVATSQVGGGRHDGRQGQDMHGAFNRAEQQQGVSESGSHGGCQPAPTQRRRASTTVRLFIFNATTVALPTGVLPTIRVPSSDHLKWSAQRWRTG